MIIDLSGKTAIVTARRGHRVRYCQGIGRGWRRGCVNGRTEKAVDTAVAG